LIRGIEYDEEDIHRPIIGPGNVAKELHVDRMMNNKPLGTATNLWVEFPITPNKRKIIRTPRIGIDYAGPIWAKKEYRFVLRSPSLKLRRTEGGR
jgi:DNA-3-methyladenine glycosylase